LGTAGIPGWVAAGVNRDRIIRTGHNGRLLLAAGAALGAVPLAFAAIRLSALGAATEITFIMAAYGFLQMYYGLVYAAIRDIVVPDLRGTAMEVYFMAM
jgi:hypothetical protein